MKVFLGGTCNESTWRDRLIPNLKCEYFNPVVKDWTEDCMLEEIRQREVCDLCLYVITPKMIGSYSIAEVVDDSNKRPSRTLFVPLRSDENLMFDDAQWKSILSVAKLVARNGAKVFYCLDDVVQYLTA